jgi:hypothetical protein
MALVLQLKQYQQRDGVVNRMGCRDDDKNKMELSLNSELGVEMIDVL